jgi:tryptophanase
VTSSHMEPFRIKVVESIPFPSSQTRLDTLTQAGYNMFQVPANMVTIDLLTDSGTGAMSDRQWSALMSGDESYAGSRSYAAFSETLRNVTGYDEIIPVHQGRAAERILFSRLLKPGDISISNTHFDTTRANVELVGATAMDLLETLGGNADIPGAQSQKFGGNLDTVTLEKMLGTEKGCSIRCVVITITNNAAGGQPVSVKNIEDARRICNIFGIPLFLDASRFAENAYLITQRDPDRRLKSPAQVAREVFGLADGCWCSLKKDGIGNIGGVLALNDPQLARSCRADLIATEGFTTYGGLAGRDLSALAVGIIEGLDIRYLKHRADSAQWFAEELVKSGLPILQPTGCHAVYVDAAKALPHIAPHELPGNSLTSALYFTGGVRACDLGTLAFGQVDPSGGPDLPAPRELVRLAIPRRVYTSDHLSYVASTAGRVMDKAHSLRGYRIVSQDSKLRHFTARMVPLEG